MIDNSIDDEIDLKEVLFFVLRRWKALLAVTIVGMVLAGGGYALYKGPLAQNTPARQAQYQSSLRQLSVSRSQLETMQQKVDGMEDYLEKSILMQVDPGNASVAKASYYIGSEHGSDKGGLTSDKTRSLLWHYQNMLGQDYGLYEALEQELGIEARYLMELVRMETVEDDTLAISVIHSDAAMAQRIMGSLQQQVQTIHDTLSDTVGPHTISLTQSSCGIYADEDLKLLQEETNASIQQYRTELDQKQSEVKTLEADCVAAGSFKALLKWSLIGALVGFVAAGVFLVMQAILGNRVYSAEDLAYHYAFPVLGSVAASEKPDGEKWRFLAVNLQNYCADAKKVLISSDAGIQESEWIAATLRKLASDITLCPAGNLSREADALLQMNQCQGAVLVARRDRTSHQEIAHVLKTLAASGKTVIGFVFVA